LALRFYYFPKDGERELAVRSLEICEAVQKEDYIQVKETVLNKKRMKERFTILKR
jgi:hypothetical protein